MTVKISSSSMNDSLVRKQECSLGGPNEFQCHKYSVLKTVKLGQLCIFWLATRVAWAPARAAAAPGPSDATGRDDAGDLGPSARETCAER